MSRYRVLHDDEADWRAFLDALARPLPAVIWNNPLRIAADDFVALLASEGLEIQPVPWLNHARLGQGFVLPPGVKPGSFWWYCAGLAHAQEAVSQLPVRLLDARAEHRVLDLCAAPGGKTAQLALSMGNRGTLLANDFSPERIAALQGNLDRLGVINCSTTWCDGGNYPAAAGLFDRILVDAPCSSEGTLRRNASLAERLANDPERNRSRRMWPRQRSILRKAIQRCRPGGHILYSTCTFAPEENELILDEALRRENGRLRLLPIELPGLITRPGLTQWQGQSLDPSLSQALRLRPQDNDTGGFFIALLEKDADASFGTESMDLGRQTADFVQRENLLQEEDLPLKKDLVLEADLRLEAEDQDWFRGLAAHYGLDDCVVERLRLHRQTRRGLHLAARDHCPPAQPKPQGSGLFFYRTNSRPPKLTTGGALLFGPDTHRNRIELTQEQRGWYLGRQRFRPSPEQVTDCAPGQLLVSYKGFALGIAVLYRSGELEPLFPKRWSGCAAGG